MKVLLYRCKVYFTLSETEREHRFTWCVTHVSVHGATEHRFRTICKLRLNRFLIRFRSVWIYFSQLKNLPQYIISISLWSFSSSTVRIMSHYGIFVIESDCCANTTCIIIMDYSVVKKLRIRICTKLSVIWIVWCVFLFCVFVGVFVGRQSIVFVLL